MSSKPCAKRLLSWALAALWLLNCQPGERPSDRSDVLLITIDTARVDRFSFMGPSPVVTPVIDSLAAEATVFTQAICPAPLTLVSHASLMTGQLPVTHGIRNNGSYRLQESATTLAELLAARGYRTGAFVGAAVLAAEFGLNQGFEHYDDQMRSRSSRTNYAERQAEETVNLALQWLASIGDEPSFVWIHLFDPHYPWEPPQPERERFLTAPYDGEIAYVDRQVGRLIDGYRALGRWQNALVVLTADHGESLKEHGEASHGVFVYDVTMRVPLLIRSPGRKTRSVSEQVQLIDVLPTLTSLLALRSPEGIDGRDLTPLLEGHSVGQVPPAYVESFYPLESFGWSPLRGVRDGNWKLVVGVADELYDLRSDPGELRDLAAHHPEQLLLMQRHLQGYQVREATAGKVIEADEQTLAAIRSLGYVGSSATASDAASGSDVDPRQHIHLLEKIVSAVDRFERGFVEEALDDLQRGRQADPGNPWIHALSVDLLRTAGRPLEADEVCSLFLAQAKIQGELRRICADRSQADTPHQTPRLGADGQSSVDLEAHLVDAERLAGQRDSAAVQGILTEINRVRNGGEPAGLSQRQRMRLAETANRIGGLCWESADYPNAAHAYSLALVWMPDDARLHYNLGLAWEGIGLPDKALGAHLRALELDPEFSSAAKHRDLISAKLDDGQKPGNSSR